MSLRLEAPEQTERRLRDIAAAARIEVLDGPRYAGGSVRLGFLAGTRSGNRVAWRYAQIDHAGRLGGGHSLCELSPIARRPDAPGGAHHLGIAQRVGD